MIRNILFLVFSACLAQCAIFGNVPSQFNTFVFGNFSCNSSETQGRLAVGGNLSANNYGFACTPIAVGNCVPRGSINCTFLRNNNLTEFGVVVNQNAQVSNAQLFTGSFAFGGNLSETNTNLLGSSDCSVSRGIPFNVTAFKPSLVALSLQLAALSVTSTVAVQQNSNGSIVLTGSNAQLEVFSITSSMLLQANSFTVSNIAAGATLIFNVNGTSFASLGNFGMFGVNPQLALWNFHQATTITFANVAWIGSVLAPNADVLRPQGVLRGQIFCNSFLQLDAGSCMEQEWFPFNGTLPPQATSQQSQPATSGITQQQTSEATTSQATSLPATSQATSQATSLPATSQATTQITLPTFPTIPTSPPGCPSPPPCFIPPSCFDSPMFGAFPSQFNTFVLGDFICSNSLTQGRLAVGGSMIANNYMFSCSTNANGSCLPKGTVNCTTLRSEGEEEFGVIVNRNAIVSNSQVLEGSFACGGVLNQTNSNLTGSSDCLITNSIPLQVSNFTTSLQVLANLLSDMTPTGVTGSAQGNSNGITLTGSHQENAEIFTISATQLSSANSFLVSNVSANTTIVVNVMGTAVNLSNFQQSGYDAHFMLFNFFEAVSINMNNIGWQGSILAPLANITNSQGNINGQIFCNFFLQQSSNSCMQQNFFPFRGLNPLCFQMSVIQPR